MAFHLHPKLVTRVQANHTAQHRRPRTTLKRPIERPGDSSYALIRHHRYLNDETGKPEATRTTIVDRIRVLDVIESTLGALTQRDAMAEGFRTTTEFLDYWRLYHGEPRDDTPVWIFTIVRHPDPIRLLSKAGDYTENRYQALPDEPEAVDTTTQSRITTEARARQANREGYLEQQARSLATRIRQDTIAAARRGADIDAELAILARTLDDIRGKAA